MKKQKIAVIAASITLLTSIAAVKALTAKNKKTDNGFFDLPEDFTVTAHTGCEGEKDNTLESIRAGAAAGADIVEIDLHYLADKTPVLSHDTPKKGKQAPSLESAFKLLSELDVKMNVDVKSTANLSRVKELAEETDVIGKIFFTGVEESDVEAVRRDADGISYFLNVDVDKKKRYDEAYISSLVKKVKDCGAIGINMKFAHCSRKLVDAFRKEGLLVSVWTANSKKDMLRSLILSPDNITTRYPSVLREFID